MNEPKDTIRGYVADLAAAFHHVDGALNRQLDSDTLKHSPAAHASIAEASALVKQAHTTLEVHLESIGGAGTAAAIKGAVTAATGFVAGLYGQIRTEAVSRMLRDDITAMSFLMTCSTMLHTTATALNDSATVVVATRLMHQIPPTLMRFNSALPKAVAMDVAKDHAGTTPTAADATMVEVKNSWAAAEQPTPARY